MTAPFSFCVRVYYEDTDAGGVVYYANYLRFMERARSEWLRALGFRQDELAAQAQVLFAVRSANVEFIKPARLEQELTVTADITRRGAASLSFTQEVWRERVLLCRGEIKVACLDARSFTPAAIPAALVQQIEARRSLGRSA